MENSIKTFNTLIQKSEKILLVFPYFINPDSVASVSLTYKLLKEKFEKDIDVASTREIPKRFHNVLKFAGIEPKKILKKIEPISYIINVSESSNDTVDVKLQKNENRLEVVLTPEIQEIDFGKITFAKSGGIYDLVIAFNSAELSDLGDIYKTSENQFKKYETVFVNSSLKDTQKNKLTIATKDSSTVSETVIELFESLGGTINKDVTEILLLAILKSTKGLVNVKKNSTIKLVTKLAEKFKINVSELIAESLYADSKEEVKLLQRIYRNIETNDDQKIIFSVLSNQDFQDTDTEVDDLNGLDTVPFIFSNFYKYAFITFPTIEGSQTLIQTTGDEATDIAKRLNGYVNNTSVLVNSDKNVFDLSNEIVSSLSELNNSENNLNAISEEELQEEQPLTEEESEEESQKEKEEIKIVEPAHIWSNPQVIQTQPEVDDLKEDTTPEIEPVVEEKPEAIEEENITPKAEIPAYQQPVMQSPFAKADISNLVIDDKATAVKQDKSFSSMNKPFDSAI